MSIKSWLTPGLCIGSLLAIFAACLLGSTSLPADRVLAALLGFGDQTDELIVWSIRLPRALAAFLVGAALGLSGAALQGLLRNPLAEPGVLGVSASASLAATFVLYYGLVSISAWLLPQLLSATRPVRGELNPCASRITPSKRALNS